MAKGLIALMVCLNAAMFEPSRVYGLVGSEFRTFGYQLGSMLRIDRVLPSLFNR